MNEANKQAILSGIRSILAIIGGVVTAHGYASDETAKEIIGAIMAVVPIIWGIWDKYQSERKTAAREAVAVNAGVALANSAPTNLPPVHPADVPAVIAEFSPPKESK